jgi:hypothetical protein
MAVGYSVADILAPKQIREVVSRVKPAMTTLSRLLGFNIGGSNRQQFGGRRFFYDTFNSTRSIPGARMPNQPSELIAPQKVGEVMGTFPRSTETISLLDEDIYNRRKVGGPVTELDSMGVEYITRQEMYLGERFANLIEFQTAAMLRGQYYYVQSGDKFYHDFSSGTGPTVDFQIPAANKTTLNIAGSGARITAPWTSLGTDIPTQLFNINDDLVNVCGFPLQHIVCKGPLWNYVVNNDYVIAQAGSSGPPCEVERDADGVNFRARLRAIPWITWHVLGHGLEIGSSSTYTQLIQDNYFMGFPDPSPEWCTYLEGSEIVTEGPGGNAPRGEQFGFYPYAYSKHDPSGWNLTAVFNGIPSLKVPKAVVYGNAG